MKKFDLKIYLPLFATLLALLLGLPYYSSQRIESGLKSLSVHSNCGGFFTVRNLTHDRGLYSSWGAADLEIKPNCSGALQRAPSALATFRVEYKVDHFPNFSGLDQFKWVARPLKVQETPIDSTLLPQDEINGEGAIGYNGKIKSSIHLGDIDYKDEDGRIAMKGMQGLVSSSEDAIEFNLVASKILLMYPIQSFELLDTEISADIDDWKSANGDTKIRVSAINSKSFSVKELMSETSTQESGNSLNTLSKMTAKELNVESIKMHDLAIETAIDGFNKKSINELSKVLQDAANGEPFNQASGAKLCAAAKELLFSGFKFQIKKLAGAKESGKLNGSLTLEFTPAQTGPAYILSKHLVSGGELNLEGMLDKTQEAQALASTFFVKTPSGLKINYSYNDSLLKINDLIIDNPDIRSFITEADEGVASALSGCEQATSLLAASNASLETERPPAIVPAEPTSSASPPGLAEPTPPPQNAEEAQTAPTPTQDNLSSQDTLELARLRAKESLDQANDRINAAWKSASKDIRQLVLPEQRKWLKARESECSSASLTESPNDSVIRETLKHQCMAAMTDKRTQELKEKFEALQLQLAQ